LLPKEIEDVNQRFKILLGFFGELGNSKTQKTLLFRQSGNIIRQKSNLAADLQSRQGTAGKQNIRRNIKN
jgi:hypothetical protein